MKNDSRRRKQEYKQAKRPFGVFSIRNTINNKIYVASGMDIQGIINRHKFALSIGSHQCKQLQNDWNELGANKFAFEIIEQMEPGDDPGFDARRELQFMEEMWLEKLAPYDDRGYNERKLTREERIKLMSEKK